MEQKLSNKLKRIYQILHQVSPKNLFGVSRFEFENSVQLVRKLIRSAEVEEKKNEQDNATNFGFICYF